MVPWNVFGVDRFPFPFPGLNSVSVEGYSPSTGVPSKGNLNPKGPLFSHN